jgi:hypothetical protein
VENSHGVGIGLALASEDDDPVADRVHRRSLRVVELDPLMLLEVAAHGRAVGVRLVEMRVVIGIDGPAEPEMLERTRPRRTPGRCGIVAERALPPAYAGDQVGAVVGVRRLPGSGVRDRGG